MGSITHGTPRDYVRRMTPPPPVSVPLNLATNMMNAENELAMEEEMNAKMVKYPNKALLNGQIHNRSASHPSGISYKKESDSGSYKISYQINPVSLFFCLIVIGGNEKLFLQLLFTDISRCVKIVIKV